MRAGLVALLVSAQAWAAPTFVQAWAGNPDVALSLPSHVGSVRFYTTVVDAGVGPTTV